MRSSYVVILYVAAAAGRLRRSLGDMIGHVCGKVACSRVSTGGRGPCSAPSKNGRGSTLVPASGQPLVTAVTGAWAVRAARAADTLLPVGLRCLQSTKVWTHIGWTDVKRATAHHARTRGVSKDVPWADQVASPGRARRVRSRAADRQEHSGTGRDLRGRAPHQAMREEATAWPWRGGPCPGSHRNQLSALHCADCREGWPVVSGRDGHRPSASRHATPVPARRRPCVLFSAQSTWLAACNTELTRLSMKGTLSLTSVATTKAQWSSPLLPAAPLAHASLFTRVECAHRPSI
jgi:hypothetical protein